MILLQVTGQLGSSRVAAIANCLPHSLHRIGCQSQTLCFLVRAVWLKVLRNPLPRNWEAILLPSQSNMAGEWPGWAILRQTVPAIAFCDLHYLLDMFTETESNESNLGIQAKVQAYPEYGVVFKEIANRAGLTDGVKMQEMAHACVKLLAKTCHGSTTQARQNKYWGVNECPLLPMFRVEGLHLTNDYPRAILGVRTVRQAGKPKRDHIIQIDLHRTVAWLARGEPPVQEGEGKSLGTHECSIKHCLRLNCLRWGTHQSNAGDAYFHEWSCAERARTTDPPTPLRRKM